MKTKVINSILMDDLKGAELLISKKPAGLEIISSLLKKVKKKPVPLKALTSQAPVLLTINTSYTCGLGCEMCNTGFRDRTFLFDDYKYFLPEQFDKLSSWINVASYIDFTGVGETLNSPYIDYFLKKVSGKHSMLITSGIPLNKKKIQSFIKAKLNVLIFSFDGKLSLGHGKGKEKYIQKFWKKVKLTQKIKKDLNSELPVAKLVIAVAGENIDNLDEIIETASRHGINHIFLNLMVPVNQKMIFKTIFINFDESKKKINTIISKWNRKGILVEITGKRRMRDSLKVCSSIDNWLHFHGRSNAITVCCGSLEIPLYISDFIQINHWNSFPLRYLRYLHFCSARKELPVACKNCKIMNLKEYSKRSVFLYKHFNNKKAEADGTDSLSLYKSASILKQNNLYSRAEKMFLKVSKLKLDLELKGKVYFHLGEIELRRKNYKQALSFIKLSVQFCFNHSMAFAYLYLLLMLLGKKKIKKRRKKFEMSIHGLRFFVKN